MQKGDELLLADGTYEGVSIDLSNRFGLTLRAEKVIAVKIEMIDGQPVGRGPKVILKSGGKPFTLRGGSDITIRGLVVDGCANGVQKSVIQCGSGWTVEDVIVQRVDTSAISISGLEDARAKNITFTRVVAQDNGYIGIGGGYADHVRMTDCASFRNNRGWPFNAFGDQGFQKDGKWYAHAQWEAGGGKFAVCDDVVVTRHWAQGNNGPGLWFDWRNTNIVVRDSMFLDQVWVENDYDALGMQLEIDDGPILVENCFFQGNVGAINIAEEHKVTLRGCHFVDGVWTRNLGEGSGYRNNGVQDLTITGNTFYGDAKVNLWGNMNGEYNKRNRIVIEPNRMNAPLPATWKVEGLPPPPLPRGMAAPIRVFGKIDNGFAVKNGWGPVEIDQSVGEKVAGDGSTLRIGNETFAHGLGVHAPFVASYPLNGERGFFRAKVGIDDETDARGSAILEIWLDDVKADQVRVVGGDAARDVRVDVTGKKKLTLIVSDAGDGIANDHVDLISPRVER